MKSRRADESAADLDRPVIGVPVIRDVVKPVLPVASIHGTVPDPVG